MTTIGSITVSKLNWRGERVYAWQGEVWMRADGHVALRAVWNGPGTVHVAAGVVFEQGDVFYEHYYAAKPYGLWQVLTPDEAKLKCWYCNVSTPAEMTGDAITFRDLLLDVLVLPDGSYQILDRDDLARAQAEGLDPALAEMAAVGARAVLALIEQRRPPFDRLAVPPDKS